MSVLTIARLIPALLLAGTVLVRADDPALVLAVDNSLRGAVSELSQAWADTQGTNPAVEVQVTTAGNLRRSLKAGGSWDLVISCHADDWQAWTDEKKIAPETRRQVARNELIAYGRKPLVADDLLEWHELALQEWSRLAVGDPAESGSGPSARAALAKRGLLDKLAARLRTADSETSALDLVLRGDTDAVLLFQSDLTSVKLPGFCSIPVPPEDYPPILYTAAIVAGSPHAVAARSFLSFLVSEESRPIWKKWGFPIPASS